MSLPNCSRSLSGIDVLQFGASGEGIAPVTTIMLSVFSPGRATARAANGSAKVRAASSVTALLQAWATSGAAEPRHRLCERSHPAIS